MKTKKLPKRISLSPSCLAWLFLAVGFVAGSIVNVGVKIGPSTAEDELRQVMETYYFGNGLADLTGDTTVLKNVVTEYMLQRQIEHCNKGLCDGNPPPHVIGDHFKVVRQTHEYAVVELEERPIIADLDRKPSRYIRRCFSLDRDGDNWRVSGGYLDCDGYLPDRYK